MMGVTKSTDDSKKGWQLKGEATASERPVGSLLETLLDFNTASKLPPTITQERSTTIETLIKQRILDELFDDPVRKYIKGANKSLDDNEDGLFGFTKSNKGLGELYEEEYRKKIVANDPNAYMMTASDVSGADAEIKKEIGHLMRGLFFQLDQLSNLHFTPRPADIEGGSGISTKNVPSLMIEDAIPIAVNVKG